MTRSRADSVFLTLREAGLDPAKLPTEVVSALGQRQKKGLALQLGAYLLTHSFPSTGETRGYAAWDPMLERPLWIKVFDPEAISPASRGEKLVAFQKELRVLSRASAQALPQLYQGGRVPRAKSQALSYVAFEALDPQSLADRLRSDGPVRPAWALNLAAKLIPSARALRESGLFEPALDLAQLYLSRDETRVFWGWGLLQEAAPMLDARRLAALLEALLLGQSHLEAPHPRGFPGSQHAPSAASLRLEAQAKARSDPAFDRVCQLIDELKQQDGRLGLVEAALLRAESDLAAMEPLPTFVKPSSHGMSEGKTEVAILVSPESSKHSEDPTEDTAVPTTPPRSQHRLQTEVVRLRQRPSQASTWPEVRGEPTHAAVLALRSQTPTQVTGPTQPHRLDEAVTVQAPRPHWPDALKQPTDPSGEPPIQPPPKAAKRWAWALGLLALVAAGAALYFSDFGRDLWEKLR